MEQRSDFYVVARQRGSTGPYQLVKYVMGDATQLWVRDLAALFGQRVHDYRLSQERATEAVQELQRLGHESQVIMHACQQNHLDLDHLVLQEEIRRCGIKQ